MTIKNPEKYDIIFYTGSRVETLYKTTKKYLWGVSGAKYFHQSTAGIPSMYYIEKKTVTKAKAEEKDKQTNKKEDILKIPTGMTLQKSLSKTSGQMHFKNGSGKKKTKVLNTKKTKRRVKKGSDSLMTFGIKMPDVRTLEDMMR